MLNKMIEDSVGGVTTMNIYRHFKGGYYVVLNTAIVESDRDGEEVVVYQSLQDGRVWVRPLSVFRELVPEDKVNPTGQKYRFERVTKFNNQLNMVSTEELVKELLSRSDCPVNLLALSNSDKVWRGEYLVGRYVDIFVDEETTEQDFDVLSVYDSLERATLHVRDNPNLHILKRVFIKQDFD